jgi:hypothetical protein
MLTNPNATETIRTAVNSSKPSLTKAAAGIMRVFEVL